MTTERPEEVIAEALSRLRHRGGPHFEGAGASKHGGHDHDHGHGRGHGSGDAHGERGRRGRRGNREHGGPALRRLVLRLLAAPEALSVSDISLEIGVDQPRASRLVAQGVEFGVLRREVDPEDARRTRIALTAEGGALAMRIRHAHNETVGAALADFTEAEKQQLADLIFRLADAWGHTAPR